MSLSNAKRQYTIKKNSLSRQLDSIPALLYDQNVGAERLEKTEKGCTAAWDLFSTTYDKLTEIQSEDEAQEAEMEDRDQEFGNLEVRYRDLLGRLADVIALRGRDRDQQERQAETEQVHQDEQAEAERAQQEKRDRVAVCRLRLTSLYGEAKESLSQLRDQLSLEEPPSAEQLVVSDNTLVSARCVMQEANKLSLEVAGLKPDIAKEVLWMLMLPRGPPAIEWSMRSC